MSLVCGNCQLFEENKEITKNEWDGKCKYKGYKEKNKRFMGRNYYSDCCMNIEYRIEPHKVEPMRDGHFGDLASNIFE